MTEQSAVESCTYPTTTVQLPSRGLFYDGRVPDGNITLRPMTTQEEKMLLSPKKDRLAILDNVLTRCIVTKDIPLADMLIGDKFFLLLTLRSITYGMEYKFQTRCPSCNWDSQVILSIPKDLEIRVLEEADKEPFEVKLPSSGKTLGLRLLRVRDEVEVQRRVRQTSMKGPVVEGDPAYEYRLALHIVTIDGEEVNVLQALTLCENMLGGDSLVMRNAIDEQSPGVRLLLHNACDRCGETYDRTMPFTASFFRPGAESGLGG